MPAKMYAGNVYFNILHVFAKNIQSLILFEFQKHNSDRFTSNEMENSANFLNGNIKSKQGNS